jgi:hypothetical protein
MDRIIGDEKTINQARKAGAGSPNVYINWDAIDSLPEQFEAVISKVTFDPKKDWSDVGNGNHMPNPDVVYDIANACGISGESASNIEPVYMEVNYNELERLPGFNSVKMCVGYKSVKQSWVLNEDGTRRQSSPCSAVYNAWDRALGMWAKEEKYTDGYSKKGKFPNKYESKYDRKAHFYELLKFAQKIAETQAFFKTIRELAGMKTGYTAEDLKDGYMIFYKIRISQKALKLEHAARLQFLAGGGSYPENDLLFHSNQQAIPEHTEAHDTITQPVDFYEESGEITKEDFDNLPTPASVADDLESIMATLSDEIKDGSKYSEKQTCAGMIAWLRKSPDMSDRESMAKFNRAVEFYKKNEIPFY